MRREPLSPSECHSSIVVNGVAFFGPVSGACLAVDLSTGVALWRTRTWGYETRKADGTILARLAECPDPRTFAGSVLAVAA